jgi:hypothetical protein
LKKIEMNKKRIKKRIKKIKVHNSSKWVKWLDNKKWLLNFLEYRYYLLSYLN